MRIAILGGGAAGMMAAASAHETNPEAEIFLIERNNELGKKVIISGGGRCNVTTGIQDIRTVLTKYPRGNKFLTQAMYAFPPAAVYEWFESHGVPLKTEEDLRVFPQSDNGKDIVGVFTKMFDVGRGEKGVHVMLNASAVRVEKPGKEFLIYFKNQELPLFADKLILTTGGQAYRQTGSTGDGYAFAQALGHTITPLAPSLNAFFTKETWPAEISGLSFEQATITALIKKEEKSDKVKVANPSFTGPILFTHKGLTGPGVFALSGIIAFHPYGAQQPLEITVDTIPGRAAELVQENIKHAVHDNPSKTIVNVLALGMPKKLADILCKEILLNPEIRAAEVTKKDIEAAAKWLKAIPLTVIGRGAGDEFVTAGGVSTQEVDPATMESKRTPGLYFAGEILDIDGFTGGFNLQASWATGRKAGESAAT